MKKIFILIVIFYSTTLLANDTLKYRSVYEYLVSNSDSIGRVFRAISVDTTNSCFIVSDQIIPVTFSIFADEITAYEYSDSNEVERRRFSDSIKYRSKKFDLNDIEYMYLESFFINRNDCELILFFGKIECNKMMAEILIRHKESDDYRVIHDYGSVVMTFLFYFEDDKVNKVFSKVLLL